MTTRVTQILTQLDGTPITPEVRCPGCTNVFDRIFKLLSPEARIELKGYEVEILEIVSKEPEPLTLRLAINRSLMNVLEGDKLAAEKQVGAFLLATRVHENDEVEFTPEEIVLIKKRVSETYQSPLVAGQVCILVDPTMKKG